MLSQIVRPLVETQIRLLANSHATRYTLVETIARWLGYLGVYAKVSELSTNNSEQIQVSLTVGKPESCNPKDWQKIIDNLNQDSSVNGYADKVMTTEKMSASKQNHLARLIAYLIQVGHPNSEINWEQIKPQLDLLNLDDSIIPNIKSALKVAQSGEKLITKIDSDLAAFAFPIAVRIALLDEHINEDENNTLASLLTVMNNND